MVGRRIEVGIKACSLGSVRPAFSGFDVRATGQGLADWQAETTRREDERDRTAKRSPGGERSSQSFFAVSGCSDFGNLLSMLWHVRAHVHGTRIAQRFRPPRIRLNEITR
jgi:hypothetical protein